MSDVGAVQAQTARYSEEGGRRNRAQRFTNADWFGVSAEAGSESFRPWSSA